MITLRIRPQRDSDSSALVRLYRAAWHATYDAIDGADWVEAMSVKLLDGDPPEMFAFAADDIALVAVRFGRIVGAIRAHRRAGLSFISGFYLYPHLQRRGIGSALLMTLLARIPPGEVVQLNVRPTSTAARQFYAAHGFVELGHGREDVGHGAPIDVVYLRHGPAAEAART